jgi:hypothetical protein
MPAMSLLPTKKIKEEEKLGGKEEIKEEKLCELGNGSILILYMEL